MPAVARIDPKTIFAPEEWARLTKPSHWRGPACVAFAWGVILFAGWLFVAHPNPLTYVIAVMLIGARQLGLAILMHEGAHRCFSRNEARNIALSQWLCAYPIFADTLAYRRYHLAHHAHTQQAGDPDLGARLHGTPRALDVI